MVVRGDGPRDPRAERSQWDENSEKQSAICS